MSADALEVLLNDQKVGVITALGGDQSIFSFDDDYADDPDRPTLSLSFKGERGGLLRDHRPTQTRLMPFFSKPAARRGPARLPGQAGRPKADARVSSAGGAWTGSAGRRDRAPTG